MKSVTEVLSNLAELLIGEEHFGEVVVLHLRGRIKIGEGSDTFRNAVRRLIDSGQKKFVVNFAGVEYIDSSGNGEMVSSYTAIRKEGGQIVFCHLSRKIQDLWTITKILTVFDVYEDVASAVAALSIPRKLFRCPIPGCNSRVTVLQSPESTLSPICGACYTRFEMKLSAGDSSESIDGIIESLAIPTYHEEYIRTTLGSPSVIEISGRLDLFACDILRKAWQTIPAPRRVIFDISQATEISHQGREVLTELCLSDEVDSKVVIMSESSQPFDLFSMPVYQKREAALAALAPPDKQTIHPLIVHLLDG